MSHPLDRAVWNALNTRQSTLAVGDGLALRYDPQIGCFGACAGTDPASVASLLQLNPQGGGLTLMEMPDFRLPSHVPIASSAACHQMVLRHVQPHPSPKTFDVAPMADADADDMLALATLTKPGPFFARTHRLGGFIGVWDEGRLIAMAGERIKPPGFAEVSGVCTHPDFRGRGLASALIRIIATNILDRGETPFLHVYAYREAATALYVSIGFEIRCTMMMTVLAANVDAARPPTYDFSPS